MKDMNKDSKRESVFLNYYLKSEKLSKQVKNRKLSMITILRVIHMSIIVFLLKKKSNNTSILLF